MIKYLISIIKSVLHGTDFTAPENINIDFEKLYTFSKAHHLAGFVSYAANRYIPSELKQKFGYEYNRAVAREATQEVLITSFLEKMEESHLRAMPLKGFFTKRLYPHPALRYMTDTDILIDENDLSKIDKILAELGFERDHETPHEVIYKSSQLVIELHKMLMPPMFGRLYNYYSDPWKFAKSYKEYQFIFQMSAEDSYIYTIDHIAKHYAEGGIGILHVADVFVINRLSLDRNYIDCELKKLGLSEFEGILTELTRYWFSDDSVLPSDERVFEMELFILGSGAYGKAQNQLLSRLSFDPSNGENTTKTRLILRKIFPPTEFLAHLYPKLKNHTYLYPFFWIKRFFRILFFRTKEIGKLKRIAMLDESKVDTFVEHCKRMGLSAKDM